LFNHVKKEEMITMTGSTSFSLESPDYNPTNRPAYDTKEGIAEAIKTLEGLSTLISQRHKAGYEREESLNEFTILGAYSLDTCGNCSREEAGIVRKHFPDIPSVLTRQEFWEYIGKDFSDKNRLCYVVDGGRIPKPGLVCAHCGKTWDISNCFDTVTKEDRQYFKMKEFVGKTLGEAKAFFWAKNDAKYAINTEPFLMNDFYIDLSLAYPGETGWKKDIIKNEHGRMGTSEGITNDYFVLPGDIISFGVTKYYHAECNRKTLKTDEERQFRDIFKKAGFKVFEMKPIKNEYCSCEHCAPWFNVKTPLGVIKVGWRKRVINIDWSKVHVVPGQDILSLFNKENVTKGDSSIHAWGWDKAQEYLNKIWEYKTM
jgi:hypothetical protein